MKEEKNARMNGLATYAGYSPGPPGSNVVIDPVTGMPLQGPHPSSNVSSVTGLGSVGSYGAGAGSLSRASASRRGGGALNSNPRLTVIVRKRPMNKKERMKGEDEVIACVGGEAIVYATRNRFR